DLAVHRIEAGRVHLEALQGTVGDRLGDAAVAFHLGEVADAPQEPVGDARRAAGPFGNLFRPALVQRHAQLDGRSADDFLKVFGRIEVEPADDAEAVPQGAGQ